MPTIDEVCDQVVDQVVSVLQTAGGASIYTGLERGTIFVPNPPTIVGKGDPFGQSLSEVLGANEALVSVFPHTNAAQNRTDRKPVPRKVSLQTVTLSAALAWTAELTAQITLSGMISAGFNIVGIFSEQKITKPVVDSGEPTAFATYQTQATDTLATTATAFAAAINAAATAASLPFSASAVGAVITITGALGVIINLGGQATMAQEVGRTMCPVQVSIWTPDPDVRAAMSKQIENGMGMTTTPFLQATDHGMIWVRKRGAPQWDDTSQSSYSLYIAHHIFECEYPTLQTLPGSTVEVLGVTITND